MCASAFPQWIFKATINKQRNKFFKSLSKNFNTNFKVLKGVAVV